MEKNILKKELEGNRSREQTLMAGIPGGVAIYRMKKDGSVHTEYVSEGLARLCGYTSGAEFQNYLAENAMVNVPAEDIPPVIEAAKRSIETGDNVSVTYRIHVRGGEDILNRLDAALMREQCGEDDLAVWYAVHTLVSDETKRIVAEESRLKKLVNEVPSGVGIYEIEEGVIKLTYLNDAYYKTIGASRGDKTQYVNEEHLNSVVEEDRGKMLALVDRLMNGADDDGTIFRTLVNNSCKWMQLSAHVVRREGKHLTVYTSISDCDSMMRAQLEISEARKREQALLSSIPGGLAIYRLRKDGTVHTDYASDGLAKMCGYKDGAELQEIFRENALDNVVEEDRAQLHEAVVHSWKTGELLSVQYRIHTKNQGDILNRTDATISFEGLKEDEAMILYAVQTRVSDAAMQSLEEQKRYRGLISALDIALFEWSEESGFYSTENFRKYEMGRQSPEAILKNEGDIAAIYPEDVGRVKEFFKKMEAGIPQGSVTLRMKMTDGTYRWTEMLYLNEYDGDGKLTRVMGVLRDIDRERIEQNEKLNKALEEAQAASKAKTAFLSRISHDMRTPLNGILGITALMRENIDNEKAQMDLQQLEMSGKYLLNLINDTLDVSKIESGKLELHPSVCDGRAIFNNVLTLIKPNMDARKINFNIHANNLPFTMLNIDVGRVEQIVMNILGNAVKFTPEGGSIDFSMTNISVQDDLIIDEIVIKDSGIGISEEFLPHLFEPFSQENAERTSSFQGSGLGMAITKQLIELMGGTIRVESALGRGTTFTLVLPLKIASEAEVEKWEAARTVKKNNVTLEGKRILLCEDHPLNANIATRLLEKRGMIVELAGNGGVGVALFQRSAPHYYDAILMDIRMPVMDGLDAARAIRGMNRDDAKNIPIIAMTANALDDDRKMSRDAGMDAHLGKPVEPDKLYDTLESLLCAERIYKRQVILVVDDIEVNRAVIRESLSDTYTVLEAENGAQALAVLEANGIDAIITDIQMPVMDGVELIRRVRSDKRYRHIAIIANTQFGEPEQEEQLLALGANDFIYKPTTPKIVAIRVRNALRRI